VFHIDDLLDFSNGNLLNFSNNDIGAPIQNDEENNANSTKALARSMEWDYSSSVTQFIEELPTT